MAKNAERVCIHSIGSIGRSAYIALAPTYSEAVQTRIHIHHIILLALVCGSCLVYNFDLLISSSFKNNDWGCKKINWHLVHFSPRVVIFKERGDINFFEYAWKTAGYSYIYTVNQRGTGDVFSYAYNNLAMLPLLNLRRSKEWPWSLSIFLSWVSIYTDDELRLSRNANVTSYVILFG